MSEKFLKANGPFSLRLTALSHGFCQTPPFEWDGERETLEMAVARKGGSPSVIEMRQGRGGVLVRAKKGRVLKADLKTAAHCLRLDEDFSGFYKLARSEPRLRSAARTGAGRILRSPSAFEDIVKSILGTNVAWRQAVMMIHRISALGEGAPGSPLRLFPAPSMILEAGPEWLKEKARVGYRAEYVVELCRRVAEGELDLEPVDKGELAGGELRELFLSIKGVGKATAAYLLTLHGEYGHLTIDSAVHALMRKINGRPMTDRQIEKRYERFGRWKALALWYEWVTASGWLDGFEK
ncbi:MAG: DNA-3-methyladenine glycosylase family protein [Candidatus Nitrospinota bacterium M3_3B_026]